MLGTYGHTTSCRHGSTFAGQYSAILRAGKVSSAGLCPHLSGAIPLSYAAFALVGLLYFTRAKRYRFFRFSELRLYLFLPAALQWSLGGFAASSAVILWGLFAPVGALMFSGRRCPMWGDVVSTASRP